MAEESEVGGAEMNLDWVPSLHTDCSIIQTLRGDRHVIFLDLAAKKPGASHIRFAKSEYGGRVPRFYLFPCN